MFVYGIHVLSVEVEGTRNASANIISNTYAMFLTVHAMFVQRLLFGNGVLKSHFHVGFTAYTKRYYCLHQAPFSTIQHDITP